MMTTIFSACPHRLRPLPWKLQEQIWCQARESSVCAHRWLHLHYHQWRWQELPSIRKVLKHFCVHLFCVFNPLASCPHSWHTPQVQEVVRRSLHPPEEAWSPLHQPLHHDAIHWHPGTQDHRWHHVHQRSALPWSKWWCCFGELPQEAAGSYQELVECQSQLVLPYGQEKPRVAVSIFVFCLTFFFVLRELFF